jgi:hypothetical protein
MTANEVALAAVVSSGVVGAAGVIFGGVTAWRDRASRREEAEREREHERKMAHDARTDEARRAFFLDYAAWLNQWLAWAQEAAEVVSDHAPGSAVPASPQHPMLPQDATTLTARRTVFGTPELDEAHDAFIAAMQAFRDQEDRLRAKTETGKLEESDLRRLQHTLDGYGDDVFRRIHAVQDIIRSVLAPPG